MDDLNQPLLGSKQLKYTDDNQQFELSFHISKYIISFISISPFIFNIIDFNDTNEKFLIAFSNLALIVLLIIGLCLVGFYTYSLKEFNTRSLGSGYLIGLLYYILIIFLSDVFAFKLEDITDSIYVKNNNHLTYLRYSSVSIFLTICYLKLSQVLFFSKERIIFLPQLVISLTSLLSYYLLLKIIKLDSISTHAIAISINSFLSIAILFIYCYFNVDSGIYSFMYNSRSKYHFGSLTYVCNDFINNMIDFGTVGFRVISIFIILLITLTNSSKTYLTDLAIMICCYYISSFSMYNNRINKMSKLKILFTFCISILFPILLYLLLNLFVYGNYKTNYNMIISIITTSLTFFLHYTNKGLLVNKKYSSLIYNFLICFPIGLLLGYLLGILFNQGLFSCIEIMSIISNLTFTIDLILYIILAK